MNRTQSSSTGSLMSSSSQFSPSINPTAPQPSVDGGSGEVFDGSAELLLAGAVASASRITRVEVACGDFVFALRVTYNNGKTLRHGEAPVDGRKLHWAQKWRSRASSSYMPSRFENAKWKGFSLSKDEFILEVGGTSGVGLKSLWFRTNRGQYGPFGKGSGTPFQQSFPQGNSLSYFFGRVKYSGETTQAETVPCTVVTELGFGYSPTLGSSAPRADSHQGVTASLGVGRQHSSTQGESSGAEARWKKTASAWRMTKALTPRNRAPSNPGTPPPAGQGVQLFAPLSGVPMEARTESLFKLGSYNNRSMHNNPFLEQ